MARERQQDRAKDENGCNDCNDGAPSDARRLGYFAKPPGQKSNGRTDEAKSQ
jgi:hypothetical protein